MANKSTNKVRVTRLFGAGATVGLTEPRLHMRVKHGIDTRWIVGLDTDHGQVSLALASGGAVAGKAYPHDLACDTGVANYFGWPGAGTDTKFGHSGTHSIGTNDTSHITIEKGDGTQMTFGR